VENGESGLRLRELESTIAAMRESLERASAEGDARVQAAAASAAAESVELKATIKALRDELERAHAEHAGAVQELERRHRDELRELQATVVALREQLEAERRNGGRP
jgi:chromosome segregation ATPase